MSNKILLSKNAFPIKSPTKKKRKHSAARKTHSWANLVLCTARWRDGFNRVGDEGASDTHGSCWLTDITQLHGIATIIKLLVRRLKWQSEVGNILERLLVVHPLHISDTFDLRKRIFAVLQWDG